MSRWLTYDNDWDHLIVTDYADLRGVGTEHALHVV